MPLRRLSILIGFAAVGFLVFAILIVLAFQNDDSSALPGVSASHLQEQLLQVERTDPANLRIPAESAEEIAQLYVQRAEVSHTVPISLRSETYIQFEGFAWAVVFDTSTGDDTGPLSARPSTWYPLKSWDYFIVLIDAECGYFVRAMAPGADYRDWPTSIPGEIAPGRTHPTEFCEARSP